MDTAWTNDLQEGDSLLPNTGASKIQFKQEFVNCSLEKNQDPDEWCLDLEGKRQCLKTSFNNDIE